MAARGRPVYSRVRQNIVDILYFLKKGYGYQIHKIYKQIFDSVSSEVVYYHLKKGVSLEEFEVVESKDEKGHFSWGNTVKKHYYKLGQNAKPTMNKKVKKYLEKI
ncbi:hypothetical protein GOV08_03775 [Candidatus Woesearchaeota archaeon]|nr:hypothetical protein [Candidatus Woesearchaeota archaeon]